MSVASIAVPPRTYRNELRAIKIVWHRDMIRFLRDKPRIITALLQPMLYLFVLGSGLGSAVPRASGVDLRMFMFPGVMAMAVLFTCFFSAGSMVWDREFGFMREMLVAPVNRGAILVGKCFGGATVGTFQGLVMFAVAGLVLGALFPLTGLPGWLTVLTRLDPLTYAVDPIRRLVLAHAAPGMPFVGVTWPAWVVPTWLELGLVATTAVGALGVAILQFRRAD